MTINELGFLSPDIQFYIEKHRAENQAWFVLADKLNRVGHQQIMLMKVQPDNNQAFLAALLLMRGLSSFQGAILLSERGMTKEARTLARGCFETVFYLGAARNEPAFVESLVRDDKSRRQKIGRALLNISDENSGLEAAHIEKLKDFLNDLDQSDEKIDAIKIEGAARLAGLEDIYNTYYRGLSNDSAHPSILSLNHYLDAEENGLIKSLRWGPDVHDVEDTLMATCTAAVYLISWAREMLDQPETESAFGECWEEYKKLNSVKADKEGVA